MVIRVDRFFLKVLKENGYELDYSTLKKLYRESRKLAELEKLKSRSEEQLEFEF